MQAGKEIVFRSVTGYVVQLYSSLGDECTGLDLGAGRKRKSFLGPPEPDIPITGYVVQH